jgi:predicted esterase
MTEHSRSTGWVALGLCLALCRCAPASRGEAPGAADASSDARSRLPVPVLRRVEVPTVPAEQEALATIPLLRPDRVELAVGFPDAFDATREHPILITQVTADHYRPNVAELEEYAATALAQGYVVLTAQGIPWPHTAASDTLMHRYVSVRAALRWLSEQIPASAHWPIIVAGFSGGAKISQVLAFSLMLEQRWVAGVFLGGCNEDHSPVLLGTYPVLKASFSRVAFFLSVGRDDPIAPPTAVQGVAEGLRRSGVERVKVSEHPGVHRLDRGDLGTGLRWFQTQLREGRASSETAH